MRLADGQTSNEGRVEVCINRRWGTICGFFEPWDLTIWGPQEARVTFRQLGYKCKVSLLPYT